jgi:hypothetical protein
MAADKTLIAGAAAVAKAKGKLSNATLEAFTELGEDVESAIKLNLQNLQQGKENYEKEYTKDKNEILKNLNITLSDELANTIYNTDEVLNIISNPTKIALDLLESKGTYNFDFSTESLYDEKLTDSRNNSQKIIGIANNENEKRNSALKIINNPKFNPSPLVELTDEKYKIAKAHFNNEAKWVANPNNTNKTPNEFGYNIEDIGFVTTNEMDEAMQYYMQPDDSKDITDFIESSTARRFKAATNDTEANNILEDEKKKLFNNKDNLEKLVIYTSGLNKQTLKKQIEQNGDDYDNFLKRQGERYLIEQQKLNYKSPKPEEPEEDKYFEAKNFIQQIELPKGMTMTYYLNSPKFQLDAQNAGIIVEKQQVEDEEGNVKDTGKFLFAHMSNRASQNTPIIISPAEPLEAIKGRLSAIYKY